MPFFALFPQDLKIALRSLARTPALWITVALTLALGIGANAAIFTVVRAVLLKPLANRDEDRLLYIRQSAGIVPTNATFSVPEIQDIGHSLKTIQELGTFSGIDETITGLGTPREIHAGVVDGNYFEVMGLKPVLGRLIGPSDDGPSASGVAVLTNRFWTNSLHSDPTVLGKVIRLGSQMGSRDATVVGVLQPSVPYPEETEIIANIITSPHHLSATMVTGRVHRMTEVFARLKPDAELEPARAELRTVYAAMLSAHPEIYKADDHYRIDVTRMHDQINSRANTILWVLFAASGLLFVIACSNVANLVLARTVRRESELAIRAALGASTADLRRSLLAESLILCGSGVIAALAIAAPMVSVLGRYAARFSVRADGLSLDFSLVWFGVALSLAAAIFLAYIPRLPSGIGDTNKGLASTGSGVRIASGSKRRLRIFAITQITASFLLLVGAGALLRTLYDLEKMQSPFDTANVLAINLPAMTYGKTPAQVADFYRNVLTNISALPGVDHAAEGASTPWRDIQSSGLNFEFAIDGAKRQNGQRDLKAQFRSASPNLFDTLGMPLLEGRDFRASDKDGAEQVVIVSQSVAQNLFPGQSALNRQLRWTDNIMKFIGIGEVPRRIVGVVPDLDDINIVPQPTMTVYQPIEQEGWNGRLFVKIKTEPGSNPDPYSLVPAITRTIHDMSGDQPVERASTLADIRAEVLSPNRLNAIVFGGFAAVALLISVVGVAGVLAFSVSGRTREFGIRMALGANPRSILTNVLSEGLFIAALGVAVGAVAGFSLAGLVGNYVAEVKIPSILVFAAAAFALLASAAIASAIPAARASKVDPAVALRSE
jgi:putative ABC transport system permease protein